MRFLTLFLLIASSITSFAQGTGLLWKVERSDLIRPSYLFGTIHLISSQKFELPNVLLKVAKEAKKHVFEADISDIDMSVMQKLMLPNNGSIKDYCSEEEYQKIQSFFIDSLQMSDMEFNMMSKMQPIFLSQSFSNSNADLSSGNMKSYELEMMKISQEYDKSIEGLESIDDQLGFLKQIPMKEQVSMLLEGIQSIAFAQEQMNELEDLYVERNLDAIADYMQSQNKDGATFNSVLLDKRNNNWIPKLESYFQESNILISVGAAHLAGETGIIEQLRAKGYAVTPVW